MQQELTETSQQAPQTNSSNPSRSSSQHGSIRSQHDGSLDDLQPGLGSQGPSNFSAQLGKIAASSAAAADVGGLDEELCRLSHGSNDIAKGITKPVAAGQRIADYERAMTRLAPKESHGFVVIQRSEESSPSRVHLTDFPNGQDPR